MNENCDSPKMYTLCKLFPRISVAIEPCHSYAVLPSGPPLTLEWQTLWITEGAEWAPGSALPFTSHASLDKFYFS